MTESKRVKEGSAEEPPTFEKHKIFLYREDLLKFLSALNDAADFVAEQRPLTPFEHTQAEASVNMGDYSARFALTPEISEENKPLQTEFDLEFLNNRTTKILFDLFLLLNNAIRGGFVRSSGDPHRP